MNLVKNWSEHTYASCLTSFIQENFVQSKGFHVTIAHLPNQHSFPDVSHTIIDLTTRPNKVIIIVIVVVAAAAAAAAVVIIVIVLDCFHNWI